MLEECDHNNKGKQWDSLIYKCCIIVSSVYNIYRVQESRNTYISRHKSTLVYFEMVFQFLNFMTLQFKEAINIAEYTHVWNNFHLSTIHKFKTIRMVVIGSIL